MDDAPAITTLPDDPQALKRMLLERDRRIATLTEERDAATRRRDELTVEKLRLEVELLRLKRWYYGRKADQLTMPADVARDVAQMLLGFGEQLEKRPVDLEDLPPDVDLQATETRTVRRVRRGRRNLAAFEELPTTRQVHDLSEDQKPCPCCGEARRRIGSETSWQVEYVPGHFERIEHVRFKYACKPATTTATAATSSWPPSPRNPSRRDCRGRGCWRTW